MLTIEQAIAILDKMCVAAPPSTAAKLSDIGHLLHSLSNDNAYLVGLYGEALILPVASAAENGSAERAPAGVTSALLEQRRADVMLAEMDALYVRMDERLRDPLHMIQHCNDLLAEALLGTIDPEHELLIQNISMNASTATRLLDGMRQIISIKCNLLEVTPLVFSPTLMLREVVRQVQNGLHVREQQLEVDFPDEEVKALGDYQQILIILLDLMDNAIYYTPQGGTIHLSAENLGTHVLFSVQDTGVGLTQEELQHVGQPFWRATHQPLVNEHPGTGLRLYLAREILKLQGGELIFSGEPGLGSSFSFTLPTAL